MIRLTHCRIARREVIEADPSVANPDHAWGHVVGDMNANQRLLPE
jgi:hypothetical protein